MKTIHICSIRKNTDPKIESLESEYIKRLSSSIKVNLIDIRSSYTSKENSNVILEKEKKLFDQKIKKFKNICVLHESGRSMSSKTFSDWFNRSFEINQDLVFVIGSAFGLHKEILNKANHILSLSQMTFTHEMARLILLEQTYRATQILAGTNYHK